MQSMIFSRCVYYFNLGVREQGGHPLPNPFQMIADERQSAECA